MTEVLFGSEDSLFRIASKGIQFTSPEFGNLADQLRPNPILLFSQVLVLSVSSVAYIHFGCNELTSIYIAPSGFNLDISTASITL